MFSNLPPPSIFRGENLCSKPRRWQLQLLGGGIA
jgi:hypothetical protein